MSGKGNSRYTVVLFCGFFYWIDYRQQGNRLMHLCVLCCCSTNDGSKHNSSNTNTIF